jgi:hypothetical protein
MSKQSKKSQRKKGTAPKPPKRKPALGTKDLDNSPLLTAQEDAVLGTLSEPSGEEPETSERPGRSGQKKTSKENKDAAGEQESAASPDSDKESATEAERAPLKLPRGGFLAFRKSGGLNFSTREVVIYPDGRVAYDARGVPKKEYNRLRRALNDGQVGALRHMLDQTGFWKEEGGGEQNPDAFAYEIAARLGQRSNEVELYDGSVPERIKPLLDQLVKLLPE